MGLLQKGLEKWLRKSSRPAPAYELPHPSPDRGEHLLYLSVVWRTRGAAQKREREPFSVPRDAAASTFPTFCDHSVTNHESHSLD